MPCTETEPMEERLQYVRDARSDFLTMIALCARYWVNRRIGYWRLARFEAEGRTGLQNHSRAPHRCPHRIPTAVVVLLRKERQAQPFWGARKLLKVLETRYPEID